MTLVTPPPPLDPSLMTVTIDFGIVKNLEMSLK